MMRLSPAVGSRVDVAAAAADERRALIWLSAVTRDEAREVGSLALKYWPRPLTAACQRSSMRACCSLTTLVFAEPGFGFGQPFAPLRMSAKSPVVWLR